MPEKDLLEVNYDVATRSFKYYIFDWDDNILHMPTKIHLAEQDEKGNTVWIGYFDEVLAQTNCADGYSSVEKRYDDAGRLIYERYTDRYNKIANNADGIASWNGYYNEDGELIITNCYDKDLNPVSMQ